MEEVTGIHLSEALHKVLNLFQASHFKFQYLIHIKINSMLHLSIHILFLCLPTINCLSPSTSTTDSKLLRAETIFLIHVIL